MKGLSLNLARLEVLRPILPFPLWQKLLVLLVAFAAIVSLYVYFGWLPMQDTIARQQQQVEQQQRLLARNQRLAQDLPRKQQEYARLEKQLRVALNMLPKKSQIPDLLENVSWAGKDSGLDFSVFKPLPEVAKQFYAEVPVELSVAGSYRQLLTFLKRVGEMSRIVDIKDLSLRQPQAGALLTVQGRAVTYRFIEVEQQKETAEGR